MTTTTIPYEVELDEHGQPIKANTPAWLRRRQTGIGASEAPAILGLSKWQSPRDVFLSKITDTIDDEQTEAMEFGHLMEPVAVELFRRRHSDPDTTRHRYLGRIEASPGLIRSTEHPHLLASLDSLIIEDTGQPVPGQIKNVGAYRRSAWSDAEGGVPDDVRVQVIQEAIVLGADHGWVLPIFGGNMMPEPIRVDVPDDFASWYIDESGRWWREHVEAGVEPPPLLMDDLADVWLGVLGESIDLDDEGLAALREIVEAKAQIKQLEQARDEKALIVKTKLGEATEGWDRTDPEHPRLAATWRPHKEPREVFHRDELVADHPELADVLAAYTRRDGAVPRPFLTK
jgi:putative phage-type endonuclease